MNIIVKKSYIECIINIKCIELLVVLKKLLQSREDAYVKTALHFVVFLVRSFGETIIGNNFNNSQINLSIVIVFVFVLVHICKTYKTYVKHKIQKLELLKLAQRCPFMNGR